MSTLFTCAQTSFGKAMRSKAKLSLTGEPEREPSALVNVSLLFNVVNNCDLIDVWFTFCEDVCDGC